MHIINPDTDQASTVSLTVRIDPQRATLLYNTAARVSGFDLEERFEVLGDGQLPENPNDWEGGRLMWCDSRLEAMILADYETACGFQSQLLWDLAAFDTDIEGPVVLSSRPMHFGAAGQ